MQNPHFRAEINANIPCMTATKGSLLDSKSLFNRFWHEMETSICVTGRAAATPGWKVDCIMLFGLKMNSVSQT